jgi:hypothetical protein
MEETLCNFPFRKLRYDKYLVLEVILHVDRDVALNFMFTISKEGRAFLKENFITFKNELINEGLITYYIDGTPESQFTNYLKLE